MTELYRSEFNEMNLRRGATDAEKLFTLLATHGDVTIVDDPSKEEILAAREELVALGERDSAEATKEQEAAEKDAAAEAEKAAERDALQRKADLPVEEEPPAEAEAEESAL